MMMMMMMMKSRFDLSFIRVFVSIAGRASEGCLCVRVLLLSGLGRTRVRVIFRQTVHLSCVCQYFPFITRVCPSSVCASLSSCLRESVRILIFSKCFSGLRTPVGGRKKKEKKNTAGDSNIECDDPHVRLHHHRRRHCWVVEMGPGWSP